jgi:hypothetical protein
MRTPAALAALAAATLATAPAHAEERDPALAVAIGAATIFAGFAVGGTLIGLTAHPNAAEDVPSDTARNIAGWFAIQGGLALAPLTSHAVTGEWARGAAFAAVPTATTLASIPVFAVNPDVVDHGTLEQQRWLWGFLCGGMAAAAVGVVDAAFAPGRAIRVAPTVGPGTAGLVVGGML